MPRTEADAVQQLLENDDDTIVALGLMLSAWEEGCGTGVAPELLAYAAIYTALTDLVGTFGETSVAELVDGLGARVRSGEFSLRGALQ